MKRKPTDDEQTGPTKRIYLDEDAREDESSCVDDESISSGPINSGSTTFQGSSTAATSNTVLSLSRPSRKFPSDLKTIKCTWPGCEKIFNRPARLAAHMRSHTDDRCFKCTYEACDKSYREEKHLKQHIKASHLHEVKYKCNVEGCDWSFLTATRLRRHSAVHEGKERYKCRDFEGCSQSFRKHATLQRHIRADHLGLPKFPCGNEGCKEGYDTAGALRRHLQKVHGEIRFWCGECEERDDNGQIVRRVGFTTLHMLQTHERKEHLGCIFCDFKCREQNVLEGHIDMHHVVKTLAERKTIGCEWKGCEKMFTKVSNMHAHVKSVHKKVRFLCGQVDTFDTNDIADWDWKGEGCGQVFVSKAKLEEHVRFVHLGRQRPPTLYAVPTMTKRDIIDELTDTFDELRRNIACPWKGCQARFIRQHDLDVHVEKMHARFAGIHSGSVPDDLLLRMGNEHGSDGFDVSFGGDDLFFAARAPFDTCRTQQMDVAKWADMQKLMDANAFGDE